ncbi:MAG: DUF116 domain-containing protein [Pseudomonadota bacterium]
MSHFKQYQGDSNAPDDRNLGDEWLEWNGRDEKPIRQGPGLFISFALLVTVIINTTICAFVYLTTPRLATWYEGLPFFAWGFAFLIIAISIVWFVQFTLTVFTKQKLLFSPAKLGPLFELTFAGVFRIADVFGVSRDRVGHSFVMVSNNISRALKPQGKKENLLLLLPRCLTKEQLKEINALKEIYPITIHTVSGGELARKKVKETKPTAVIGVACERDLVSGIRDVGTKFFVIGIPNQRPEGPCKNTYIDMSELVEAIEFFVGKPTNSDQ